ncbi:putative basic helix-loop-helix dna-binding superfamily protein, partial [Trifolium medium]|nr:putative basic helix-loop-helix dna-binding superfamily protein [Trifolium medium]
MELETSHSITVEMRLLNEEMYVMQLVLKQGISEAQLKLANYKDEMDLINKEKEGKIFQLMKQLEMKDDALISAQKELTEEREKAACLMSKMREIESYGSNKELQHSLQSELDRYKEMLEESTNCQRILEEKLLQMESDSKEQLRETHEALDIAINELDERIC